MDQMDPFLLFKGAANRVMSNSNYCNMGDKENSGSKEIFREIISDIRRLATVDRLFKFGISTPMECVFCGATTETMEHLFFLFPVTRALWIRSRLGIQRTIGDWQSKLQWASIKARNKAGKGAIASSVFAMTVAVI
ncbi:hypothetical protein HAX54_044975 [Datura stramonium]|uniref:Reverse transcriptase zinc-binding domain-containing protein n=1 Tax=Datura stramonium TaxID=4076 RepID=A0ABS8SQ65_DATST|nr:hypothetical protein [Datura stramonium]